MRVARERACAEDSVEVVLGSAVERIEVGPGSAAVRGVRLASGDSVPADVVVSNVDALTVYRDLLPTPSRLATLTDLYELTMAAGYQVGSAQPYVPDDLELLCIELVKDLYKDRSNLQSESIGSWSRTFNTQKVKPFVEDTLAKYSRISL